MRISAQSPLSAVNPSEAAKELVITAETMTDMNFLAALFVAMSDGGEIIVHPRNRPPSVFISKGGTESQVT